MNRVQKIGTVVAAACLAIVPALAQSGYGAAQPQHPSHPSFPSEGRGGPFGPGAGLLGLERLDHELGLTDAQKTEIEAVLTGRRDALRSTMASMRQAEQALAAAVMQVPADDSAVQARAGELSVIQAQLTLARAQTESKIYQLLTPEQQQKAQEWFAQMQHRGGRRGGAR